MRWQHPQRGMIAPMDFIPIAEETGMIVELGRWALHRRHRFCQGSMTAPGVGQCVTDAVQEIRPRQGCVRGARRFGLDPRQARNRGHRAAFDGRYRSYSGHAAQSAVDGRFPVSGRFRVRLFEPWIFDPIPVQQDQDRPLLYRPHAGRQAQQSLSSRPFWHSPCRSG